MKKLMFILSAIAMVGMVQAATVDWKYTITGAATASDYASGYTAYLFDAATWEGLSSVTADSLSSALDSSAVAYWNSTGRSTKTYNFATSSAAGTVGSTRSVSNESWGSTEDFYIVLVNTNEDPTEYLATAKTLTTRGATDSPNTTGAEATTQSTLSSATWSKISSGGTTDVPEPTSGILMLVGLGALALRRRRA